MQKRTCLSLFPQACQILLPVYIMFTQSSAGAMDRPCEFEMSKPAIRFLKTLQIGLAQGAVKVDDVNWLIQQPAPAHPIRKIRAPETLALIQELRRDISHLSVEQWPVIVQEVGNILNDRQEQRHQIQAAKKETRHIFTFRPTRILFSPREEVLSHFTSRQDTFIYSQDEKNSYVFNLRTRETLKIEGQLRHFRESTDFFETANGDVVFALISKDHTTVINLSSGQILFQIPTPMYGGYRPLLYESDGKLNLALGTNEPGSKPQEERDALVPRFRFIYSGVGEPELRTFPLDTTRVVRLRDGHLYGLKIEHRSRSVLFNLRDFTLEKDVFDEFELDGRHTNLDSALIYNHGPQLLIKPAFQKWNFFDSRQKKFITTHFVGATFAFQDLIYPGKDAISAQGRTRARNLSGIEIMRVFGLAPEYIVLPFQPDSRMRPEEDRGPHLFQTHDGPWTYEWEWDATRRIKLHIYNLETKEIIALPASPTLDRVYGIFREAHTGRILLIARKNDSAWKIYTIYGPEEHQQSQ